MAGRTMAMSVTDAKAMTDLVRRAEASDEVILARYWQALLRLRNP